MVTIANLRLVFAIAAVYNAIATVLALLFVRPMRLGLGNRTHPAIAP